jgi:hypothetical protein
MLGLLLVPCVLLQGGKTKLVDGVLEIHGGIVTQLLRRGLPWTGPAAAMVFGHVVLGCDALSLQKTRRHERVHVRQYERWGPLFIPAYLLLSFYCYARGRHPYHDNPFEVEAFNTEDL